MRYMYTFIIVAFLVSISAFSQNQDENSQFFKALNMRYQNPDSGIMLAKQLKEVDSTYSKIALGYNFLFKSDYNSAKMNFESVVLHNDSTSIEYCLAMTGLGLILQRYGNYSESYDNLKYVDKYSNKNESIDIESKVFNVAKTINLIGLATLNYYYNSSYEKTKETAKDIERIITINNDSICDELKFHVYYLLAENLLNNSDTFLTIDTLATYLKQCIAYSNPRNFYQLGNLFELLGKHHNKINDTVFKDIKNNYSNTTEPSNLVKKMIIDIYDSPNNTKLQFLKASTISFINHGDPYQIAASYYTLAKYYHNSYSDSLIISSKRIPEYLDSLNKFLNKAELNYHSRDSIYLTKVIQDQEITTDSTRAFISRLLSHDWYIKYLHLKSYYYGLINNKSGQILKEYLFNIKLIEILEKEKYKAINDFFLKMEVANEDKLKSEVKAKNSRYRTLMYSSSSILVFVLLSSVVIIWYLRKKRNEFQSNFFIKSKELKEAQEQLVLTREKQAKLEVKDKLIGWFAHETKTQLEIAVTGLTTNKKLLLKFTDDNSIAYNTKEYYRIQRINENIDIILDNIKQTNRVTKQLREISLKQIQSDLRTIDLQDFLYSLFEKLKYQRDEKNIILQLTGDINIVTKTYPIALDQIFFNLMVNSIKHGFRNRKHGRILINIKRKLNHFDIEYTDNGIGIEKGVQRNIFKEFFSSIKGGGGTGLGMPITRTIIERDFNGTIRLKESIPNIKTTFSFNLKRFDDDKISEN